MKRTGYFFVAALFISLAALAAVVGNFPKPVGHVNDWANLLQPDAKAALEEKLRAYEQKTSIEIAIVTTPSLGDMTVEDYTIELAQGWGVGKKGKDNGIVLLIAPNERKLRIEVGYGLEGDFTDMGAGRIRDVAILPHFKNAKTAQTNGDTETYRREMAAGVIAGADAIIGALGNKPFAERLEERQRAEEERQRKAKEAEEATKTFVVWLLAALAIGIPVFLAVRAVLRSAQRRRELRELHEANGNAIEKFEKELARIEKDAERTSDVLDRIKRENPRDVWRDVDKSFSELAQTFKCGLAECEQLKKLRAQGWEKSEVVRDALADAEEKYVNHPQEILMSVAKLSEELKKVKSESAKFFVNLPGLAAEAEKAASHEDVFRDTRKNIGDAKRKLEEARGLAEKSSTNWLAVFALLSSAAALLGAAKTSAKEDVAAVADARKRTPEFLDSVPREIGQAEKAVNDDDVEESTKKIVADAKRKYAQAKKEDLKSPAGLASALALLLAAAELAKKAKRQAEDDKEEVERRRRRRRNSSSSYSSGYSGSSWSSGSFGSSSSSGGGFGGFGGGGFGGGGASGSW